MRESSSETAQTWALVGTEMLSAERGGVSLPSVAQGLGVPFRLKPQKEPEVGVITRSVCGV